VIKVESDRAEVMFYDLADDPGFVEFYEDGRLELYRLDAVRKVCQSDGRLAYELFLTACAMRRANFSWISFEIPRPATSTSSGTSSMNWMSLIFSSPSSLSIRK